MTVLMNEQPRKIVGSKYSALYASIVYKKGAYFPGGIVIVIWRNCKHEYFQIFFQFSFQ